MQLMAWCHIAKLEKYVAGPWCGWGFSGHGHNGGFGAGIAELSCVGLRVPMMSCRQVRKKPVRRCRPSWLRFVSTARAWHGRVCRSFRFFRIQLVHKNSLIILSPSCSAVFGHSLSPRMAIVFSLLSSPLNASKSLERTFVWFLHLLL